MFDIILATSFRLSWINFTFTTFLDGIFRVPTRNHKNDSVLINLGRITKFKDEDLSRVVSASQKGAGAGSWRWSHVSRSRAVVTEVWSRPASDGSIVFYDFNRVHKMADKWWHAADELNKLRTITDRLVTRSPVRSRGSQRGRVAAEAPSLRSDLKTCHAVCGRLFVLSYHQFI